MPPRSTRHHPWLPVMLLLVVLPLVLAFFYFQIAAASFRMFGLTGLQSLLLLVASIVGSMINIPLTRRRIRLVDPTLQQMSPMLQALVGIFHYYPPVVEEEIVAINVGGAVIPIAFCAYLLTRPETPLVLALVCAALVALIAKLLARPVPGVGITLPNFVPPILSAIVAFLLVHFVAPHDSLTALAAVAYIGGTLGTLIGADLLNLPLVLRGGLLQAGPQRVWRVAPRMEAAPEKPRIVSIGGAGVFDGIFLTGVLAAFLVRL